MEDLVWPFAAKVRPTSPFVSHSVAGSKPKCVTPETSSLLLSIAISSWADSESPAGREGGKKAAKGQSTQISK